MLKKMWQVLLQTGSTSAVRKSYARRIGKVGSQLMREKRERRKRERVMAHRDEGRSASPLGSSLVQ